MEAEWVPVLGFERYLVHRTEGIKNRRTGVSLTGYVQKDGYPTVKLQHSDGPKLLKIHRLVAIAFIPNPNGYKIVNHKDGNKTNYSVNNLEWVTSSGNAQHAADTGLRKGRTKGREVDILDEDGQVTHTFPTVIKAAQYIGCTDRTLHDHFANRLRSDDTIYVKGYVLRYSPPPEDFDDETWSSLRISLDEELEKYEISNHGRVRFTESKLHCSQGKLMGYPSVNIDKKPILVHRLMAFTYLEPDGELFDVNHIDKNQMNNRLSNLEVMNRGDHLTKDLGKKVLCTKDGEEDMIFPSIAKAAAFLGVTHCPVTKSIKKGSKCQGWNCSFVDN